MPALRAQKRERRAHAPKVRRRRNLTKFVPSSDSDFAMTARGFADHVWKHKDDLDISEPDAEYLVRLVRYFREAMMKATSPLTRNAPAITNKNRWRKELEQWLRPIAAKIRNDSYVERSHKVALRLVGLPSRKTQSTCPQRPPILQFIGSGDGVDGAVGAGNGSGVHVLKVYDRQDEWKKQDKLVIRKARPDGAMGVELWVGFIPEGMRVPTTPQEYLKAGLGWPLFLRPYTTRTIEAKFPMPDRPMLIVYWARWTNHAGDHGRFCKTCVARIEGWPKEVGQLPEQSRDSQSRVNIQHGAQHAFPAVETKLLEGQRMFGNFMLIGTPLALPAGGTDDDDDDANVDAVLQERRMLPEAA